jgi:hypothetical protein
MTKKQKTVLIVAACVLAVALLVVSSFSAYRALVDSGITQGPDAMFGDQHLKTAVALIELHKVRCGRYPETLKELKFTGQWDQMALNSVRYYTNEDGTAYFVEVTRGWVGKPKLEMPVGFWQGTGYRKDLKLPAR